jgi:class 3 adenylate cyclase/tetratricopeptide (TPR) repeat protein
LRCAACGSANTPGTKFCGECGAALSGAQRPRLTTVSELERGVSESAPLTEIRRVSVLFADLVGFTSLSESRDAEEVRDLLSRYFDTCRQLIGRYGGCIEKFIGDAVMAVWGTPLAREDDAERSVRAALELTEAVSVLGREAGLPELRARAGVLTGEAAVNIGAEGQGMVAGDLVNTASRIQAAAPPGAVLVGETTRRSTEAAIAYEDAGVHELKGKAEPVALWQAVRVIGLRGGVVRHSELEPPFVGRDRELHLIKELFHVSAEERRLQLVSVIGIGGIGKSRLSWEFEKYVDGLAGNVWWHRGRCLAYGDGVAFRALAEMVRTRAGIVEDEDPLSARSKLHAALEAHVPDGEERRFIEPRLLHLLALEDRGPGDQENLFSAWRLFFERLSDAMPIVMVFEDLHWADSALLDFIEYLLDWSRDRPIFIFTLGRPELSDRRPTWGAGKRNFTSLFLDPLPSDAMSTLLRAPVPGLPDELHSRILQRAEGVPFYAVETVRMLLDRGLIVREGASYRPVGAIETLEVPDTLQALIAARLDGLTPDERQLVQDASVLGRTFTVPGVSALTGVAESVMEPQLMSLVRKEVLALVRDPLSPERGQYSFLQDLVKKVAYDTMSKKRRRALHLAAAAFLEAGSGLEDDEVVEIVASHYLDAYRAGPDAPDAQDVREKARDRLMRAAERASSLGATLEAQRYFERAAELTEEPLVQAELFEQAGVMAQAGARGDQAVVHFERSIALFEGQGSRHLAARVQARLTEVMWDRGRLAESLESMERAFQVLVTEPPDEAFAWLAAQLARFHFFSGDTTLGDERIETALDIAEALGLPEVLSQALNTKHLFLMTRGRHMEARALLEAALRVAIENDKPSAALRAYNNLIDAATTEDRYEEAQSHAESGLNLARRVGNRYWERTFTGYCYPLYALGRWDDALAQMAELSVEDRITARIAFGQGYVAFGTAIHVHRGNLDQATERVAMFADFAKSADVQEQAEHACAEAVLCLGQQDADGTVRAARRALKTIETLGLWHYGVKESVVLGIEGALLAGDNTTADEFLAIIAAPPAARRTRFLQAHMHRLSARLANRRGEPDAIEPDFISAARLFREIGLPFWLAVTLLEQGEWLTAHGRQSDATVCIDESHGIFQGLGASPWLRRLSKLTYIQAPPISSPHTEAIH